MLHIHLLAIFHVHITTSTSLPHVYKSIGHGKFATLVFIDVYGQIKRIYITVSWIDDEILLRTQVSSDLIHLLALGCLLTLLVEESWYERDIRILCLCFLCLLEMSTFHVWSLIFSATTAFKLNVTAQYDPLQIPIIVPAITLDGREFKVVVTDYTFGSSKLLFSTA